MKYLYETLMSLLNRVNCLRRDFKKLKKQIEELEISSGPQGESGPQGPQGESGPQGIPGEIGPQGEPGEDDGKYLSYTADGSDTYALYFDYVVDSDAFYDILIEIDVVMIDPVTYKYKGGKIVVQAYFDYADFASTYNFPRGVIAYKIGNVDEIPMTLKFTDQRQFVLEYDSPNSLERNVFYTKAYINKIEDALVGDFKVSSVRVSGGEKAHINSWFLPYSSFLATEEVEYL